MPALHDHDNLGGSNRWVFLEEAAALIGVPPASLRNYWRKWGLKTYKTGGRLKWRERDLYAWLEKRAA